MDPVQDPQQNLPPTIMPTTEETVPPPPPTPVVEPSRVPTPVPASDNAQVVNQKKKWGTGVLIGSVTALMVIVVGLGFGVWQVKQNQKIILSKAGCACINQRSFCGGDRIPNIVCGAGREACCSPDGGPSPTQPPSQCQWTTRQCIGSGGGFCGGKWCAGQYCEVKVCPDNDQAETRCGGSCPVENPSPTPTPYQENNYDYITFACDRCASDRRCQTPDVGTNPRFSTGNNPSPCNQVDRRINNGGGTYGVWEVVSLCEQSCSGETPPPQPPPPPAPPPGSSFQCQQVKTFRNDVEITPADIQLGDTIVFKGFASAVNTTVSKLRFTLTKGGVPQSPVDVNTTLVSGQYQADYSVNIDTATSYSVSTAPISP